MVVLGDVFSIVAALVGICVTAWAMIMGAALLFQGGAARAMDAYRQTPWRGFFIGLGTTAVIGLTSVIFIGMHIAPATMVGTMLYLSLMALAALGSSGIALVISERIASLDPNVTRYGALIRATSILVIAGVFPLLGWFLVAPILTIASIGYGVQAILTPQHSLVAPPVERM